jgi:hypothetical protein
LVHRLARFPVAQACNSDWAFVPVPASVANQRLIQPRMRAGSCQHGGIALEPLAGSAAGQDFLGILFGDCTGNWQPTLALGSRAQLQSQPEAPVARLGRLENGRGHGVRLPLSIDAAQPFSALEIQLSYEPTQLRPIRALPGSAAQGAVVATNTKVPGLMTIALASAEPIDAAGAETLLVEFQSLRSRVASVASVRIVRATVDGEIPAVVDAQ